MIAPREDEDKYNICLIGSGGVGTIASLVLEKSRRANVTVVLRSRYEVIKDKGWNIESVDHGNLTGWRPSGIASSVEDAALHAERPFDYVVVTTKQLPDVYSVPELIRPVVKANHTAVVLIQNGIDIEVPVISTFPSNPVMSAVSMIGSRTSGENTVIQVGTDVLTIGPHFHDGLDRERQLQSAREFVYMYTAGSRGAGAKTAECILTEDMPVARWQKLLWNATFNTLCAMMRMNVGELQSSGGRTMLLIPAMHEVYAIAKAVGHPPPEHMIDYYAYRLPDDCLYRPSMLFDLEHGRPMELEVVLGNALKRAEEYNLVTPILSTLYELLKLEQCKINQGRQAVS
ncbi:2-dehydropantoate 2-reductase [Paecilomyces variotii No. 5]|uniref:2-dehydropantoate 2-reductase n=1 Tax=Byssochlamys spectabilis (strain No. 5 / NBRC 109023) TaxID=1356009 RepID=V5FII3_BYSSN|nr:2-dehydropantoate 2-reductase [Paecilomyces variotii No. 5]